MFNDDITPIEKLYEIVCNASPAIVVNELQNLLARLAACEILLENAGIGEKEIKALLIEQKPLDGADSLALGLMATILSQNE